MITTSSYCSKPNLFPFNEKKKYDDITKCENDGCELHAPETASANDGSCIHALIILCGDKYETVGV